MMDPRSRRVMLVLPPAFPHALLSILLTALFGTFQCPGIGLFSAPVLSAVGAGVRSALVVDIGWHETVVTVVYEYREIHSCRTVRAGKTLVREMRKHLGKEIRKARSPRRTEELGDGKGKNTLLSVDEVEDVLVRFAWCRGLAKPNKSHAHANSESGQDSDLDAAGYGNHDGDAENEPVHAIYLKSTAPPLKLLLPFSSFSQPVEAALFATTGTGGGYPDDEELPIGLLAYNTLMSVPIDVRSICMSRIMVVGGPSAIPGLKKRVVDEISSLCQTRGSQTPSRRYVPTPADVQETPTTDRLGKKITEQQESSPPTTDSEDPPSTGPPAAFADQEVDHITEQFRRIEAKESKPSVQGLARGVESLGAWSGASLIAAMKIRGVVEVERDKFLQHGLAGATRDAKYSVVPSRSTASKAGAGDRSSWTLGVWA